MLITFRAALILLVVPIFTSLVSAQTQRMELGNLVIEDIPEIPQRISERTRQYQNTRSASIGDWDPAGGGMLISTRFAETSQLHYLEKPLGMRRQVTFFAEPVGGAAFCPDLAHHGFLFSKDIGGNEYYQIYYFDLVTAGHQLLTDGKSRNGNALWSNHSAKFAYTSTKRNGRDHDIYLADLKNPAQARCILKEGGAWEPVDFSGDDTRLLVQKYVSITETYYYLLDINTTELIQVNPREEKIAYGGACWAADGKSIFITSDQDSEFQRLRYYDLKTKTFTDLTGDIDWNVSTLEISPQRKFLAFTTNENGISKLYLLDTGSMKYRPAPNLPLGQIYGLKFNPTGNKLGLVINTARSPGDIYVLDLKDNALTRWTQSEVGGLNTDSFVDPVLISYPTFDNVDNQPRNIPAFYYQPSRAQAPYPVLIYIHGGPEGQYRPRFSPTFQYWLNELGIAVIAPNVRGSAGYGKSYVKLDNGFKREDSVRDIGTLLDWIKAQPELDSSRVAVLGGSYGGYMTLASMTHYNDRLACAVDIVGISNFVTFLKNTKDYRRDLRRVEYGDERDFDMNEFLQKISPTTNVRKITKPMFIAQGANDPRVPASEAEQMVTAIRNNGGDVWYLLARDEGHGFRKKSNRDYYTNAVIMFLEKYLLKK